VQPVSVRSDEVSLRVGRDTGGATRTHRNAGNRETMIEAGSHAVAIYPSFLAINYSPYVVGLAEIFGTRALVYTARGFPAFHQHGLAFVAPSGARIVIDAQDWSNPFEEGLEWADLYAKVNLDPARIPAEYAAKVIAAGPSFPVKIAGPARAIWRAVRNYQMARSSMKDPRRHFGNWRGTYRWAVPERRYQPGVSSPTYAFFGGSIWKDEPECNEYRRRFIEACRSLEWLEFEGGFAPRYRRDVAGLEAYTADRRYDHPEWIAKSQRSGIVFNTPAVYGALAWKLPEFLALGKAIICTPLARSLSAPLVHGEHIHFVEGSVESIREAISMICRDDRYRVKLEQGARAYYVEHLQPARAVSRIIQLADERLERQSQPSGTREPSRRG
jgi:hypothetical protein